MKPLTERDLEVLAELVSAQDSALERMERHYAASIGFCPREFGGRDGSDHGKVATKLVGHGFVEQKPRWHSWGDAPNGGPKVYRPTPAGREATEAWNSLRRSLMSPSTVKHGHTVPNTSYREATPEEQTEWRRKCHLEMPK